MPSGFSVRAALTEFLDLPTFCERYGRQIQQDPIAILDLLFETAAEGKLEPHRLANARHRHRARGWQQLLPEDFGELLDRNLRERLNGVEYALFVSRDLALAFTKLHELPPPAWWQAMSLTAPAEEAPTQPEPPQLPGTTRGRPRDYPWDEVGAAFGAWLHQEPGRPGLRFRVHYDAVVDLLHELGHAGTPDQETVRPLVKRWKAGYLATLGKPAK
jgi:hypothetical protein